MNATSGNTPRAKRRWDGSKPRHPEALIVRCRGRRVLAIEAGDPARLSFTYRGQWATYVLDGSRFRPDRAAGNPSGVAGPTRVLDCPYHAEGHTISGARLREAVDRLARYGAPPTHVDVGDIRLLHT
jgi:hypothetical protein